MKLPSTRPLRSSNNPLADTSTGTPHYPTKFRDNQQNLGLYVWIVGVSDPISVLCERFEEGRRSQIRDSRLTPPLLRAGEFECVQDANCEGAAKREKQGMRGERSGQMFQPCKEAFAWRKALQTTMLGLFRGVRPLPTTFREKPRHKMADL